VLAGGIVVLGAGYSQLGCCLREAPDVQQRATFAFGILNAVRKRQRPVNPETIVAISMKPICPDTITVECWMSPVELILNISKTCARRKRCVCKLRAHLISTHIPQHWLTVQRFVLGVESWANTCNAPQVLAQFSTSNFKLSTPSANLQLMHPTCQHPGPPFNSLGHLQSKVDAHNLKVRRRKSGAQNQSWPCELKSCSL
jgi:hypothetical protein